MNVELWPASGLVRGGLRLENLGLVDLTVQPEHLDLVSDVAHHAGLDVDRKINR